MQWSGSWEPTVSLICACLVCCWGVLPEPQFSVVQRTSFHFRLSADIEPGEVILRNFYVTPPEARKTRQRDQDGLHETYFKQSFAEPYYSVRSLLRISQHVGPFLPLLIHFHVKVIAETEISS
jgi:hypothetical protein